MRTLTSLLLVLATIPVPVSAADNMAQSTVRHECAQIDPAKTGFSCSLSNMNQYGMQIHWREDPQKMTKERRADISHQRKIMALRFYQVGGRLVTITANHWSKDKAMQCSPTKSRQSEICFPCRGKDEHGNWKCEG